VTTAGPGGLTESRRLIRLLGFDGERLLVQRAVPTTRGMQLAASVATYRRAPDGAWLVDWSVPSSFAVQAGSQVLYSAPSGDGYEVRARDQSGVDVTWKLLTGRPVAGSWNAASRTLAMIVERSKTGIARPSREPPCLNGHVSSLSDVRRGGIIRELVLARPEKIVVIDVLVRGDELTGEIAYCGDNAIVVGVQQEGLDGSRRFGLVLVDPDRGVQHRVVDSEYDLSAPVATATTATRVACVAISRQCAGHPVAPAAALVTFTSSGPDRRVLAEGWVTPKAWLSDEEVLCVVDSPRRRGLRAFHIANGLGRALLEGIDDVSDVLVNDDMVAVLTSSPFDEPTVKVVALSGEHTPTTTPGACGRRPDVSFLPSSFDGLGTDIGGIWLCQPASRPRRGMLALFHGGPIKRWGDWSWRWNPYPFLDEGYGVALIDTPMSVGYGQHSMKVGWGQWRTGLARTAGKQVQQARVACGATDEPLAVMGGSFGGYLAIATAREVGACVVVAHAPPTDLQRVAAGGDAAWQWLREYGDPVANRKLYEAQSVTVDDIPVGARVLLSHGMTDDLVPVHDSIAFHRGLLRSGVRSELMLFADEAHAMLRPANVQSWYANALSILDETFTAGTVDG
jgi:hypothetical protein